MRESLVIVAVCLLFSLFMKKGRSPGGGNTLRGSAIELTSKKGEKVRIGFDKDGALLIGNAAGELRLEMTAKRVNLQLNQTRKMASFEVDLDRTGRGRLSIRRGKELGYYVQCAQNSTRSAIRGAGGEELAFAAGYEGDTTCIAARNDEGQPIFYMGSHNRGRGARLSLYGAEKIPFFNAETDGRGKNQLALVRKSGAHFSVQTQKKGVAVQLGKMNGDKGILIKAVGEGPGQMSTFDENGKEKPLFKE